MVQTELTVYETYILVKFPEFKHRMMYVPSSKRFVAPSAREISRRILAVLRSSAFQHAMVLLYPQYYKHHGKNRMNGKNRMTNFTRGQLNHLKSAVVTLVTIPEPFAYLNKHTSTHGIRFVEFLDHVYRTQRMSEEHVQRLILVESL